MKDEPLTKSGIGQRSTLWPAAGRFWGKHKKPPRDFNEPSVAIKELSIMGKKLIKP